jgi:FKBP-type peptidyl-prolyl cis-trans isomerase (trigger factor)
MEEEKKESTSEPTTAEEQTSELTEEQKRDVRTAKNIVTVEEAGPCKKKIVVEIPEESIKEVIDEQYKELGREAVLPGFRKGRRPVVSWRSGLARRPATRSSSACWPRPVRRP